MTDALAFLLIAMLVLGTWVAKLHLRLTRMGSMHADVVHLRYDPHRPDSVGRWTAIMDGHVYGDGRTPAEALEALANATRFHGDAP